MISCGSDTSFKLESGAGACSDYYQIIYEDSHIPYFTVPDLGIRDTCFYNPSSMCEFIAVKYLSVKQIMKILKFYLVDENTGILQAFIACVLCICSYLSIFIWI